ncbi:5-formyltetrahydrofolate cyclo-ligase [Bacilli bacterium PM5-9]|nr:5-formyltetrahydrofolate cyclo-ligase [Bacilli bacterium PM5-9]
MDKNKLRKEMIFKRSNQDNDLFNKNSDIIINKVIEYLKENNYQNILIYMDMQKEVTATRLIDKGFNIYITKTMPDLSLKINKYNKDELVLHKFGYYESSSDDYIDPSIIDTVIVPGVAFDINGNRLGFGKGYYDRFLVANKHLKRIAVAFEFQIVKELPTNQYDQAMDLIISEKKNYLIK